MRADLAVASSLADGASARILYLKAFLRVGLVPPPIDGAPLKARSAALWRRPTSSWIARAADSAAVATQPNVVATNGGELIILRGQVVGAIGVSGSAAHELDIAKLAAAALQ